MQPGRSSLKAGSGKVHRLSRFRGREIIYSRLSDQIRAPASKRPKNLKQKMKTIINVSFTLSAVAGAFGLVLHVPPSYAQTVAAAKASVTSPLPTKAGGNDRRQIHPSLPHPGAGSGTG
jgi:hypothetical protein